MLDTSCSFVGLIEDLLKTGFIEGQLLLPQFILQELQRVADSSSDQKRARGRRGLDIINRIRKSYPERVVIDPADYDDVSAGDAKLVKLAQEMKADLLTTDYNLNKVASVQRVSVLNINDLAKALRPTYLPGDDIEIRVL